MDESLETKMGYFTVILNNSAAIFQLEESYYPPMPRFMEDAPDVPEKENFYIIKHGIRFTGMPGWGKNFSDDQLWKLTHLSRKSARFCLREGSTHEEREKEPAPGGAGSFWGVLLTEEM